MPRSLIPLIWKLLSACTRWVNPISRRAIYYENATKHAEKEATLRKTVFAIAGTGQLDFDTFCDNVIAQIEKIRTMAKAAVASA